MLAILGTFMNADGTNARPSLDTLAGACNLSRRQVSNHLRPALERGWLERDSGRGPGSATTYRARTPIVVESGQPVSRTPTENGKPAAQTAESPGTPLPESGQPASTERAAECPPPDHDQIKTTTPAATEAAPLSVFVAQVMGEEPKWSEQTARAVVALAEVDPTTKTSVGGRLKVGDYRRELARRVAADARTRAAKSRECNHGKVDGMRVSGVGANASRKCGACEVESPAPDCRLSA
ncbi:hypothetical protein FE634_21935 [Nocardioides dongxiaopingii]|uniref:helix-turn-helix domain-containing protein n=1 Tax=Nocardioides sp. S-1144 TaxID=2582905 RepID=UPI0011621BD8|nr:helix-turn-helix domain-containing protein [Nocardioides sp. S-1144]QDH11056.1 hypothetical protein FE634_21935 [Nocardioides sp. S-1144]